MNKKVYQGRGERLDVFVADILGISRNKAQNYIKERLVFVNGRAGKPSIILEAGDNVEVQDAKDKGLKQVIPKVKIVFENKDIIVIDKDPGIVVYPDSNHKTGTLLDAVRPKIDIESDERPGVVHRLDKDTSGLIVFAKNSDTERALKREIKSRKFEKIYLALVWGHVEPENGKIEIPIRRSEKDRKKMEASDTGKDAFTEYEVVHYYNQSDTGCRISQMTLLKVKIITGRTHQIRVHLAAIGYPVVGDKTYGRRDDRSGLARQFLHASDLSFKLNGKMYSFHSDLPKYLRIFLEKQE